MATALIQLRMRRDTDANWTANDPTLAAGEIGINSTIGEFKIGDGVTAWSSLPYFELDFLNLKDGVDGELITWDATGKAAAVAVGVAGQVLTSGGAGVAPTFQTPLSYEKNVFQITFTSDGGGTVTVDTTEDTLAYTKVGDLVTVQGDVLVDSVSTPSGDLIMNGLPHMSAVLQENADRVVAPTYSQGLKSPLKDEWSAGIIEPGQTTVLILQADGSSLAANVEAGSKFFFNFSYIAGQSIVVGQVTETDLAQSVTVVQV